MARSTVLILSGLLISTAAILWSTSRRTGTSASGYADLGSFPAAASLVSPNRGGVRVAASAARSAPRELQVTITLQPERGHRLVRRPPNEISVSVEVPGVAADVRSALLGDSLAGPGDSAEVIYYDGPASVTIPVALRGDPGSRPVRLHGLVSYRACDDVTKQCYSAKSRFTATG